MSVVSRGFLSDGEVQRSNLTDIAAKVVRETEKAWLIDDGAKQVWIPKSQAEKNPDNTFTLPEWMALEKGLI